MILNPGNMAENTAAETGNLLHLTAASAENLVDSENLPQILIALAVIVLIAMIAKHSPQKKLARLRDVDRMSGTQFEHWCALLLRRNGFKRVEVVGKANDQGADIIAHKFFRKYVIQCKCYHGKLGNKPVQEVNAAVEIYRGQVAVVMTNSHFTKGGIDAAKKCDVLLWDRERLIQMGAKP